MHELSIALSIVDVVNEEAERHDGRVAAVHLKLGPLSGVVAEALLSAFGLAREGTALEQTELVIKEMPIIAYCPSCTIRHQLPTPMLCCPVCGGPTPEVVSGRELEVVALEIVP
jgi:hydrogenase nickel incorporation protein HypA/HybF